MFIDVGVDYVVVVWWIFEEVENVECQVMGEYQELKGELVIFVLMMFGCQYVFLVISEFIVCYLLICVCLLFSDCNVDLVSDYVDLVVWIGDLVDSSMVVICFGIMWIVVCVYLVLLVKYGELQWLCDLVVLLIICIELLMFYCGWCFCVVECEDQLINLLLVLFVIMLESVVDVVWLGVGVVCLLYYQVLDGLCYGEFCLLLENVELDLVLVYLLYIVWDLVLFKLCKFIDFVVLVLCQVLLCIVGVV